MTVDVFQSGTDDADSGCCEPAATTPALPAARAERVASVAKALSDPVRVGLVDVLRDASGEVCQCELTPLFGVSQPTLSHHLRKLREAGIVDVERRGVWAYYSIRPQMLEELHAWLS